MKKHTDKPAELTVVPDASAETVTSEAETPQPLIVRATTAPVAKQAVCSHGRANCSLPH